MKKLLIILIALPMIGFGQLPNGSIAPDFTLTDINGTTHTLYNYTDAGYTVFIHFDAVWNPPGWSYHQTGALQDLYVNHGPIGYPGVYSITTNDVMVIFIEGEGNTVASLGGSGSSVGDWITGTPFPIICTDGTVNSTSTASAYSIGYWPTIYQVCPDRTLTECGQPASPYSLITSCLPVPSYNNDVSSFMNNSANSGCSSVTPEISIQNYGLNNLTEVKIDVSLNGVFQYSTIFDQVWSNTTNSYQPLNLATLEMVDVLLDPVTGLVNGDVISIDVTMPNGVVDEDSSNNQIMSFIVDIGFDNAYWNGQLYINVAGNGQNSWYLKKVSNNLIIASGFGGVTGATNSLPLTYNECYVLQSINGANLPYNITDAMGNIILVGSASSVEDFDHFTTGNQIWSPASTPTWDCDGLGNCSDPGTGNGTYASLSACQTSCGLITSSIYDIVSNSPDHTTLKVAIDACALDGTLSGAGPFTLFAPTDAAFNLLPAGTVTALLADIPQLTDILLHHVVGDSVLSTMLSNNLVVPTLNGDVLVTINSMSEVFIDNAQVIVADLVADNGVVHVIDAVLLPTTTSVSELNHLDKVYSYSINILGEKINRNLRNQIIFDVYIDGSITKRYVR